MKEDKKKFSLRTFGCQMNVRDSEVIAGLLKAAGYKLVEGDERADIVILNTCSVRQHAENKVWSEVGRLRRQDKQGHSFLGEFPVIGIVGCMAKNYQEKIFEKAPQVDFVVGPSDIHKIPEIVKKVTKSPDHQVTRVNFLERKIWEADGGRRPEEIYHTGFYEDKEHAYVVISEGCSNYCSYCIVPYVRGQLHNRDYREILKEIEEATNSGITKITLLGQNVNAYRSPSQQVNESGVGFIELLRLVNGLAGVKEFSFITSHPKDTTLELFQAMAECGKLKKYLHLPVQSGSDRVLRLMGRGYTRKFYFDLIENYRRNVKNGLLTTDIIVGFPGETEEDFQDTYNLVNEAQFNAAFIFKYSPRPHTEAAKLIDNVEREEKEKRHALILALQKDISKRLALGTSI